MKAECERVQGSLGAWLDGEAGGSEAERIEAHLEGCPSCSGEKRRLERLQNALKDALETRASVIALEPFWSEVRRRISEERPWRARLRDWARPAFHSQRLAWAIPLVIIFLLGVLSLEQFFPGWRWGASRSNGAAVDSIDGHGFNVAVFRESKTKTTVIWLFENQEEEDEAPAESSSTDSSF